MKTLKRLALTAALLGTAGITSLLIPQKEVPIELTAGELKYSSGRRLKSEDYASCSALILDSGNKAVMAHAVPNAYTIGPEGLIEDDGSIDIYNVVEKSLQELRKRGIKSSKIEAMIHAGSKESYDVIFKDLIERGINIAHSHFESEENFRVRNIEYDPVEDHLLITFRKPKRYETTIP